MTSSSAPALACVPDGHCVTCSDEGVPMRVSALQADGLATCADATGAQRTVDLGLVFPVSVGDELLVHAGVALLALPADEKPPPVRAARLEEAPDGRAGAGR